MVSQSNGYTDINGYIDIHCHIIPHVDDGAQSSTQAMKMISIAYENGIRTMIATPHYEVGRYDDNAEDIKKNYEKITGLVKQKYPDFTIHLGNEIFYSYGVVDALEEGKIFTMAGSRYVLVEFSPNDKYSHIRGAINELVNNGYIPIIAHCERYEEVMADSDNVEELVDAGAYIQINAHTVAGKFGRGIRKKVLKLIKDNLVHFIGTDAHSDGHRTPDLEECLKYLRKKTDEETIQRLLDINPQKVIANEYI
jgi:protein-tyrosine phosphatase